MHHNTGVSTMSCQYDCLGYCCQCQQHESPYRSHLFAVLTLVRPFASMLAEGVLDDVVLTEDGQAADLAVVFADGQRELGVVEHGAVKAVVEWVREPQVAPAAI